MNEGKYIFTQVCSLIPRQIFQRLVSKYQGVYHVRDFNCTTQLRYMLFGQLTSSESLRDICLCLKAHEDSRYALGMATSVNESSLSRANEKRDYHIYEGLDKDLIDYSGINVPLVAVCNVPPVAQCNVPPQKWLQ